MVSPMRDLRVPLAVLLTAAIAAPTAFGAGSDVLEGTYEGSSNGVNATVMVDDAGDGELRYTLKSSCGKSKGTIDLAGGPGGSFKGSLATGRSSVIAQLRANAGGELDGLLRHKVKPKSKGKGKKKCSAKNTFTAILDVQTSPVVKTNVGHYEGTGQDGGLPISFDVAFDAESGGLEVSNMAFQSNADCYDDLDLDGEDDTIVANVSGLAGDVEEDGFFVIESDDANIYVDGMLEDGTAEIYLEVGGFFAADGTPMTDGPFECDSFGETYTADRS